MPPTQIRTATVPTQPAITAALDGTPEAALDPAAGQMRAVTQDRYGSAEVLRVETIDRPDIGPEQVLIEVHAAGLDRGVWHLVTGRPYLVRLAGYGITRPKNRVPGLDVAGRVLAVGGEVTRFAPGDAVFGIATGSFAEVAAADEEKLAHIPAGVSFEQAAASAVSGITALQALTDVGAVEAGQRVLVVGGSGGVGTFAVQLARALGATVDAVAGTRNVELVRALGADEVFDHSSEDFTDTAHRYDLVLDIGGRNSISRLRGVLTPRGTLVIVGGEDGDRFTGGITRQLRAMVLSPFVKQRLTSFISTEHHSYIERLAAYLEDGSVVPVIGQRFDLEGMPEAIRRMEAGEASGKSVIVVREGQ